MKLIVGFGNTGREYDFTRHNIGFLALDYFFKLHGLSWQTSQKFHSIWAKHNDIVFLKPQTFYNEVGLAVKECTNFFKIDPTHIIAVCDDFNLEFIPQIINVFALALVIPSFVRKLAMLTLS